MRDFEFYVTDDRYDVRSFYLITAMNEADARRTAERLLTEPHHHSVEVWERGERLFTLNQGRPWAANRVASQRGG